VLQENEIRPLGAQRVRKVDVRVVAATNRDLEAEVRAGRFRRDLYYRLAAFPIHLPSLRERPMDIPLILDHVLTEVGRAFRRPVGRLSDEALAILARHDWPGNVREVQNEIQRMAVLAGDGPLTADLLSPRLRQTGMPSTVPIGTLKDMVETLERNMILAALEAHDGNISRVANALGLSRVGLRNKLHRYDLRRDGLVEED